MFRLPRRDLLEEPEVGIHPSLRSARSPAVNKKNIRALALPSVRLSQEKWHVTQVSAALRDTRDGQAPRENGTIPVGIEAGIGFCVIQGHRPDDP